MTVSLTVDLRVDNNFETVHTSSNLTENILKFKIERNEVFHFKFRVIFHLSLYSGTFTRIFDFGNNCKILAIKFSNASGPRSDVNKTKFCREA